MYDTYFIPKDLEIENMTCREILKKAILLRNIEEFMPKQKVIKFTFKNKQISETGKIIEQNNVDCEILNIDDGKQFLDAIGYNELMSVKENDTVYAKDDLEITIKNIENGDKLIEVEVVENNEKLDTVEKVIKEIEQLQIPIYTNDYFVKKAEIELGKVLNRK